MHWLIKQITNIYQNHFSRSYENRSIRLLIAYTCTGNLRSLETALLYSVVHCSHNLHQGGFSVISVLIYRFTVPEITGSPSSKNEQRRASALLRNIRNIRICMGKKPIVSVTYDNERISIKKDSSPYIKCVLRLFCVGHGPIYGRFVDWLI